MVLTVLFKEPDTNIAFVALVPPVKPPVTAGVNQLYNVPAGTMPLIMCAGVRVNEVPLQVVEVIVLTTAEGLTVILTVNAKPVQLPDAGVTV